MFGWPSGLRQQTVNLPREMSTSIGSNPIPNAIPDVGLKQHPKMYIWVTRVVRL